MKRVLILAQNTFWEVIRDRILYGLVAFALFLLFMSLVLGQLSFAEQIRISINLGLTAIHMSCMALALFIGGQLVFKEIEKQTILVVLSHSVSRSEFLLGKYLGFVGVLGLLLACLGFIWSGLLLALGGELSFAMLMALLGIGLEALIVLAMTMFFGCWSKPFLTVLFSLSFLIIGHWLPSLDYFAQQSSSGVFQEAVQFVLPNLEMLNWRDYPLAPTSISLPLVAQGALYAGLWVMILLCGAMMILRRRDFV